MNDTRRKKLSVVSGLLDRAIGIIDSVSEEEQDSLDNMPENFQDTERSEKMENAIALLESAVDQIEDAKENLRSAME